MIVESAKAKMEREISTNRNEWSPDQADDNLFYNVFLLIINWKNVEERNGDTKDEVIVNSVERVIVLACQQDAIKAPDVKLEDAQSSAR